MTDTAYDYAANCRSWPKVDGPFSVGTLEFEVTDPLRSSQYAPTLTPTRRLYARAWYPAGDVTGCRRRPYFTEAEATALPCMMLSLFQQPVDALREGARLMTNAWADAPPAAGRFPVVGFNHGYTSYPSQQTALFEHLAARGYIILTVGHPWESGGIVYPDGDAITMSRRIVDDLTKLPVATMLSAIAAPTLRQQLAALRAQVRSLRDGSMGRLASVWRDDVYFVLDRLEENAVPAAAALAAAIDHDRRAYMGMSYGAYTAGLMTQGDPRARALVHLDGGIWTWELVDTDLRTPFLTLGTDLWAPHRALPELTPGVDPAIREPVGPTTRAAQDLAYERHEAAGARTDGHRFLVPGINHLGVSDLPDLAGAPAIRAVLGTEEALPRFTPIQNALVGGFLDRYLGGIDNGFPGPALAACPEVIVQDLSWLRERALAER
ncbi:MAG: hypothetical protein JNJ80_21105 [Gemmatimonadetes bacterium]|nr:hypothetical protein [Gemmatimonadota bacterium]